jgi:hypothetical protein
MAVTKKKDIGAGKSKGLTEFYKKNLAEINKMKTEELNLEREIGRVMQENTDNAKDLFGVQKKLASANNAIIQSVQEQAKLGNITVGQAEDLVKTNEKIAQIGSSRTQLNTVLADLEKEIVKALEEGNVARLEALESQRNLAKATFEANQRLDKMNAVVSGLDQITGGLATKVQNFGAAFMGPMGAITGVFAILGLVVGLLTASAAITDNIGDSFGVIGVQDFHSELVVARADFERMGFSAEEMNTAVNTLSSDFGMTVGEAAGLAKEVANNAKALGMTTDESAKLLGTFKTTAGLSAEQADLLIKQTGALAQSAGVAPAAIFKDMAGSAGVIAKFTDGTGENIARAAVKARQLGLSLSDVAGIAEGFLDVQGSIEKEMEASLMIGRDLNLTKARELSLAGDVEGLQDEILSIVGSQAEFNEMDVLQRKSLASALNMNVEQLSKYVAGSEKGTEALKEMSEVDPAVIAGDDAMSELTKLKNEMKAMKTEMLGLGGAFSGTMGIILPLLVLAGVAVAAIGIKMLLAGKAGGKGMSSLGKGVGRGMTAVGRGFRGMGIGLAQLAAAGTAAIPILLTLSVVGASLALVITAIGYVISKLPPVITAMAKGFALVAGAIGDVIINVFNKVKELAEIGGMKLISTATGITAIGVSLAAFGGGSVLAGIGSFVGNLLGGDPIKKFERFAKMGPQLTEAAVGLRSIGAAIEVVNTERIKQIGDYLSGISLLKLAALGAMGKLSVPAGGGGGAATVGTTAGMTTMEQKEAEPLWVGGIKSEIRNFKHDLIGVFGFHGDEISAKIGKQVATNIVAVAG